MFKQFFERLKHRRLARQLRKPSGKTGVNTGIWMNKANEFLYTQAIAIMNPATGEHLLEIGFGNGKFFSNVFASAPGLHISGIDYSQTMVNEALIYNKEWLNNGSLQLIQGNSDKLPYADNSFDKIYCVNVLYFWDEPSAHLQEIKRVLKPGGRFYAIIRSRESLQLMPFSQFGFTKHDETSWQILAEKNDLHQVQAIEIYEPEIVYDGKPFRILSYCLTAGKSL